MSVPDFQSIMLPLLRAAASGQECSRAALRDTLAIEFVLTEPEKNELLPSGRQTRFANRVAWATHYLQQAGLLRAVRRGVHQITDRGREVLLKSPKRIDIRFLDQFPEFLEFRSKKAADGEVKPAESTEADTPEEAMESAHSRMRMGLAAELLTRVKTGTPQFFERLVVELLIQMGYGGSRRDAGQAIGRSGDEGIDGVISEDRLGLDIVYIQAKRWEGTVGRPEIQKFVAEGRLLISVAHA